MIRLRVSDLDSWVNYADPREEWLELSFDDFLARMERRGEETPAMAAGKALHDVLEHAAVGDPISSIDAGVVFHFDGDIVIRDMPEREGAIIEKVYATPSGPVLLRGKTDARDPVEVVDYKLTFSTFDAEQYAESLQWRAYLDMTGRRKFRYEVLTAKWDGPEVVIREQHPLTLWAYPEMGADVQKRVAELAEFVVRHVPALITTEEACHAA